MLNKCLCVLFLIKTIKSVGIFKYIRTHYGNQVLTLVRQYEKLRAKRDKLQLDIAFLTSCVDENIIPKFLFFPHFRRLTINFLTLTAKLRCCFYMMR